MARSIVEQLHTRSAFDRLDAALRAITALNDPDVLAARIALGKNVGCLVTSHEERRVITISARTFPPYDDEGHPIREPADSSPETKTDA